MDDWVCENRNNILDKLRTNAIKSFLCLWDSSLKVFNGKYFLSVHESRENIAMDLLKVGLLVWVNHVAADGDFKNADIMLGRFLLQDVLFMEFEMFIKKSSLKTCA